MNSRRCSPKNSSGRKTPSKLQKEFFRLLCKALEKNAAKIPNEIKPGQLPTLRLLAHKPGRGQPWLWLAKDPQPRRRLRRRKKR